MPRRGPSDTYYRSNLEYLSGVYVSVCLRSKWRPRIKDGCGPTDDYWVLMSWYNEGLGLVKSLNSHGSEGQHGTDADGLIAKCPCFAMHSSSPADPFLSRSTFCGCASLKQKRLRPPLWSPETVLLLTPKWPEQTNRPCCPRSDTVLVSRQPGSYWRCPFSDGAWVIWM